FCRPELIRNRSDAARFSNHHFRISSVHGYSGDHRVLAIHNVSASARFAHTVFATEETDTDPFTDLPSGHSATQGFNAANYFMPGKERQRQTPIVAGDRGCIGVTVSSC